MEYDRHNDYFRLNTISNDLNERYYFIKNRKTPLTHRPFCTIFPGVCSFPL